MGDICLLCKHAQLSAAVGLVALTAACGGGNQNAAGISCQAIGGGAQSATACASGCSVEDPAAAADGNMASFATLTEAAGAGGVVSVTSVPRNGVSYPAGTPAGVIFDADAATQTSPVWTVTTYLNGTVQDTDRVSADGAGSPERPIQHSSIATTKAFDSIQFSFTRSAGVTAETVRAYELCTD